MMKFYDAKIIKDAKNSEERRYRNILANSGKIMESGEIRDLENLYVMSRDGKLIAIKELNTNPDEQTEEYTVKAQADHGQIVDGELVDTIEKQFGSCKVWIESDGLHARMYFANDDDLANHAWAISEDASYSTGIDWYPDGYYGAEENIDDSIGILREISMVLTGNDPRAKTIDHKEAGNDLGAKGSKVIKAEDGKEQSKGDLQMAENAKTADELTPDENAAIKQKIVEDVVEKVSEAVDEFTTKVPESETEPTARDEVEEAEEETKDEEESAEEETKDEVKAEKDSVVHNINVTFRDKTVKNETVVTSKDSKKVMKNARNEAIRDALKASGFKFDASFNARFEEAMKTKDGVSGLGTPLNITNMFSEMMEKSDGILSYVLHIGGTNGRGLRNNALAGTADYGNEAQGHKKGDTKVDETITNTIRVAYDKMVYKKLSLDAMEIYENPELLEFRARELFDQIILSIERAIFIGDGRSTGTPDLRMFDSSTNTGLYPINADCAAQSGYGTLVASTYTAKAGDNLYDGVVGARQWIRSEGAQILVVKPSVLTAAFQAKVGNRYLIEPGATAEDIFRVDRVFSPMWMEYADEDAFLLVKNGYTTTGERNPRVYPFFDVNTNQNILLNEMPIGGTLTKYKSACAITGLAPVSA